MIVVTTEEIAGRRIVATHGQVSSELGQSMNEVVAYGTAVTIEPLVT